MKTLSETEKMQLGLSFLAAWKNRSWALMKTLLSDDVTWSLPGESLLSGEVQGSDAITLRAGQLKDFGVQVELRHILFSRDGLALALHNTAKRGQLVLDEHVLIVCDLAGHKISRLTTYLDDIAGIEAFFVAGIIDQGFVHI